MNNNLCIMNPHRLAILLFSAFTIGCDSNATNTSTTTLPTDTNDRDASTIGENEMTQTNYDVADIYTDLRNQVLQFKPDAIGQTDADQSTVLAILMETGYPEAVATLIAVADGTASLYFSNGGGIIGGGEHEPVRKMSGEFISLAQHFVSESTLTDTFPLPKKDNVRCYLVTRGGIYTFEALEDDLGYERHPCSPLFHKGHELITAIREHSPD
jgi:hypothetical protein